MSIKIVEITADELDKAVRVLNDVPEFDEVFNEAQFFERIGNKQTIILVAEYAGKAIGCKIAYNRYFDGSIYSWMGGVLPMYREQGVADLLQQELEKIAGKRFFNAIRMKTRNMHGNMIRFAIKHGYYITAFEAKTDVMLSRIEMKKDLNG